MSCSNWDSVRDSLLLHPEYRIYEANARDLRRKKAQQLGLSLDEYDEKLSWGFSEFYD